MTCDGRTGAAPHGRAGRDPGDDAPPVLLQDEPAAARAGAAVRRRVGAQGRGVPRDPDPGPARRAGHGRLGPLPPAVAGQHAAVPGRQGAVLRRELLQRGARVRAAAAAAEGPRGAVGVPAARGARPRVRPGVLQRAAGRPLDHLPDHHGAAAERPADRADLHEHLRAAAPPARAVRQARPDDPRADRRVADPTCASRSSAPGTCRWSSAARGSSARTAPTRSSTRRRSSGSRTATSTAASPT